MQPDRFVRKVEVRCPSCPRSPLLGMFFRESDGSAVLHVKVHKQNRIMAEVLVLGEAKVRCRECLRWHEVKIDGVSFDITPAGE